MPELHWPWAGLATVNLLHCSSQKLCSWYTASHGAIMFSPFLDASASGMPNVSRVIILATIKTGKPSYPSGSRIHLFFKLDSSSLEPCWISVIQSKWWRSWGGCSVKLAWNMHMESFQLWARKYDSRRMSDCTSVERETFNFSFIKAPQSSVLKKISFTAHGTLKSKGHRGKADYANSIWINCI